MCCISGFRITVEADLCIADQTRFLDCIKKLKVMCDSKANSVHSRSACQFFKSGQCARGQHCHYLHLDETRHDDLFNQDMSGSYGNVKKGDTRNTGNLSRSTFPSNERSNFNLPICNHFLQRGWCRFGRECKFSHSVARSKQSAQIGKPQKYDMPLAERNMIVDGEIIAESLPQMEGKSASSSNKYPSYRKLCRFYKAGFCSFGQRCRFQHIASTLHNNPFTTMRSRSNDSKTCELSFDFRSIKSANSETSSDSGLVEDFIPRHKRENLLVDAISEADTEGEILIAAVDPNCPIQCSSTKVTAEKLPRDLRSTEIEQLKKRYPQAKDISSDGQSVFQFIFTCTDPDWVSS